MTEVRDSIPEPPTWDPYPRSGVWGSLVIPAGLGHREIVGSNPTTPTTTTTT